MYVLFWSQISTLPYFPDGMNPNGFYPKTNRMNLILFIIHKYRS